MAENKDKTVTLVHHTIEGEIQVPEDDQIEQTNLRAAGWATKPEQKAAEKAEGAK